VCCSGFFCSNETFDQISHGRLVPSLCSRRPECGFRKQLHGSVRHNVELSMHSEEGGKGGRQDIVTCSSDGRCRLSLGEQTACGGGGAGEDTTYHHRLAANRDASFFFAQQYHVHFRIQSLITTLAEILRDTVDQSDAER